MPEFYFEKAKIKSMKIFRHRSKMVRYTLIAFVNDHLYIKYIIGLVCFFRFNIFPLYFNNPISNFTE